MLLVAKLATPKRCKKNFKMNEILAHGYSSESTKKELSNEYQHGRVQMIFKVFCSLVPWKNAASALEGLRKRSYQVVKIYQYEDTLPFALVRE